MRGSQANSRLTLKQKSAGSQKAQISNRSYPMQNLNRFNLGNHVSLATGRLSQQPTYPSHISEQRPQVGGDFYDEVYPPNKRTERSQ